MKSNLKLNKLFVLIILSMSSIGFIFIITLSNMYSVNKADLFNKDTWISNPNAYIENTDVVFSNEDLEEIKVTLTEQNLFYYEQLSDEEKKVFNYIYLGIKARKSKIEFENPISIDELTKFVYIIKFDCPELYYLGNSFDYDIKNKKVITYYPDYIISEKKYNKMQEEISSVVSEIKILVKDKTEYDAELIVHNYIVENCVYDIEANNCNNLYGALIEGKANCEGYSSAFMYLLRQIGIEATQVIGEINYNNETIGHSWNLIKINGDYYYTDICWDDLEETPEYSSIDYHYAFFNLTYDEITQTRDISKNIEYLGEIPKTEATKFNYYKKANLYAESLDDVKKIIEERLPSITSSNSPYIVIKCNGKDLYNKLLDNITDIMQETITEYKLPITKCKYAKIDNGNTLIIHSFSYSK